VIDISWVLLLWMSSNNTPADQVHLRTMNPSAVSDLIRFLQINIQHNKTATGLLCKQIADLNHAIVLIQEPWTNKNKILGLGASGTLLFRSCSENNARTCVITKGLLSGPLRADPWHGRILVEYGPRIDRHRPIADPIRGCRA